MSPIHGLQIRLWIPITVIKNDCICSHQVDAQAARPRAEEKNEGVAVLLGELLDLLVPRLHRSVAVDPVVFELTQVQVVFHYVQDPSHLGEKKHLVTRTRV
jgi:hypothetical protein